MIELLDDEGSLEELLEAVAVDGSLEELPGAVVVEGSLDELPSAADGARLAFFSSLSLAALSH